MFNHWGPFRSTFSLLSLQLYLMILSINIHNSSLRCQHTLPPIHNFWHMEWWLISHFGRWIVSAISRCHCFKDWASISRCICPEHNTFRILTFPPPQQHLIQYMQLINIFSTLSHSDISETFFPGYGHYEVNRLSVQKTLNS